MNSAVFAVAVASVVVGLVVLARIATARQQEEGRTAFRLVFPRDVRPARVAAFLSALSGRLGDVVTVEVAATDSGIGHRLVVSGQSAGFVADQLRAAIPGVRIVPDDTEREYASGCELRLTNDQVPLRTDEAAATSTAIIASLDHGCTIQWTLTPQRGAPRAHRAPPGRSAEDRLVDWIADRLLPGRRTVADGDERRDVTEKASSPLFRAALRVGVAESSDLESIRRVVAGLGSVRAPGAEFQARSLPPILVAQRLAARRIPALSWPVTVNAAELAALLGWPLESPIVPGLTLGAAPHLPPVLALPQSGLVLGTADFPGMERPVAISVADAMRHLHVPGPTGVGKSTLALNLLVQELESGCGVCVIDPKGDLVADLLERIPREREDDVIVVDPLDARPVGINLLDSPPGEGDLTADQVVGVFARRFGSAWGPRTDDIARAAVLTLLTDPSCTIADLPALFTVPAFRRSLVGRVDDLALAQFWQSFEAWSEPERAHNTAPLLNKVRSIILRRPVRAIVGQPSTVSLDRVLADGKVLLVSLSAGLLGENAAALLGGLLFARLWAAVQRRASLPASERRPFLCTLDEFQTLVSIPTPLDDVLALARGYGFGLTLLHQHLGQLPPDIRHAVLANCRTKVVFASSAADAAVFAKELAPWVEATGLVGLGAYGVVISATVDSQRLPPVTALTAAPPPFVGRGEIIRAQSRSRYGRDVVNVERMWRQRTHPEPEGAPIGRRRTGP